MWVSTSLLAWKRKTRYRLCIISACGKMRQCIPRIVCPAPFRLVRLQLNLLCLHQSVESDGHNERVAVQVRSGRSNDSADVLDISSDPHFRKSCRSGHHSHLSSAFVAYRPIMSNGTLGTASLQCSSDSGYRDAESAFAKSICPMLENCFVHSQMFILSCALQSCKSFVIDPIDRNNS